MTSKRLSYSHIEQQLAAIIRRHGYRRAGWWLGEEAAAHLGLGAGHHTRHDAARAIRAGFIVTADLGYTGTLSANAGRTVEIHPNDLGLIVRS
tara:strand:- start:1207 stop:1485 length:279 start_codon:yes stop_codon:yes gene_type:complete